VALDPIVKMMLDQMAAMNAPKLGEQSVEEARAGYKLMRSPNAPEAVARVEEITVAGADGDIPARMYAPESGEPLPVLVFYHGGGWVIGDLDTHDGICRMIANRANCVVVSVDYRLAPEHKYPAAAEDAYAALTDISKRAGEFGFDPTRIAVGGDSAGGNLSAVVAQMARDRGGPALVFQALVYPVCDYDFGTSSYNDNAEGYMLTRDAMKWFWNNYLTTEADGAEPCASPLRAESLAGLPPALVITAEYDPLRDEGDAYAARLKKEGVAVKHSPYPGMIHGFFQLAEIIPAGKAAIEEVSAELRSVFEKSATPA
jgi:acetyl esterase